MGVAPPGSGLRRGSLLRHATADKLGGESVFLWGCVVGEGDAPPEW
jgi:hypothetical protein